MKELVKYPLFYEQLPLKTRSVKQPKRKHSKKRGQRAFSSSILANR